MVDPCPRVLDRGRDILGFEIRQLFQDLGNTQAGRQQVEHIDNPDPHPSDAGPAPALAGFHRDPFHPIHARTVTARHVGRKPEVVNCTAAIQYARAFSP